jgi:hypothetical protein
MAWDWRGELKARKSGQGLEFRGKTETDSLLSRYLVHVTTMPYNENVGAHT